MSNFSLTGHWRYVTDLVLESIRKFIESITNRPFRINFVNAKMFAQHLKKLQIFQALPSVNSTKKNNKVRFHFCTTVVIRECSIYLDGNKFNLKKEKCRRTKNLENRQPFQVTRPCPFYFILNECAENQKSLKKFHFRVLISEELIIYKH